MRRTNRLLNQYFPSLTFESNPFHSVSLENWPFASKSQPSIFSAQREDASVGLASMNILYAGSKHKAPATPHLAWEQIKAVGLTIEHFAQLF